MPRKERSYIVELKNDLIKETVKITDRAAPGRALLKVLKDDGFDLETCEKTGLHEFKPLSAVDSNERIRVKKVA